MFAVAKSSLISWFGITGGVLTIFSNLQGILDLARWANWLADNWGYYVVGFWRSIFGVIGIRTDADATMMICMAAFVTIIAIGSRLENEVWTSNREEWAASWRNALNWRVAAALVIYVLLALATYYVYFIPGLRDIYVNHPTAIIIIANLIYASAIVVGLHGWPLPSAIIVAASMVALSYVFSNASLRHVVEPSVSVTTSFVLALGFAISSGLVVLMIAPPRAFCRRLIFMLAGVAVLVSLSALSAFDISVDAPPVG